VRRPREDELNAWVRLARTALLFAGGMAGIAYETIARGTERPTLLLLFGAMIGLPFVVKQDEKSRPPEPPPTPDDRQEKGA
jgi:hypothetical protein